MDMNMDIALLKDQKKFNSNIELIKKPIHIEAIELLDTFEKSYTNTTIKVADLAECLKYSERTLRRKSRQYFDDSPIELLQKIRLKNATYLLNSGVKSSYVWHQVGFSSHSYFSDLFKAYYGVIPSEFS
jgi:AraC-like DNA-binding protein